MSTLCLEVCDNIMPPGYYVQYTLYLWVTKVCFHIDGEAQILPLLYLASHACLILHLQFFASTSKHNVMNDTNEHYRGSLRVEEKIQQLMSCSDASPLLSEVKEASSRDL